MLPSINSPGSYVKVILPISMKTPLKLLLPISLLPSPKCSSIRIFSSTMYWTALFFNSTELLKSVTTSNVQISVLILLFPPATFDIEDHIFFDACSPLGFQWNTVFSKVIGHSALVSEGDCTKRMSHSLLPCIHPCEKTLQFLPIVYMAYFSFVWVWVKLYEMLWPMSHYKMFAKSHCYEKDTPDLSSSPRRMPGMWAELPQINCLSPVLPKTKLPASL